MIRKFKSRTAGLLSVGIVALALGAASVAPSPISAAGTGATISALTPAQQKAKKAALKKCYKIKNKAKRKACIKRVNKKYAPPKSRLAATVGVHDDYFSVSNVTMKKGESIKWVWDNSNRNAHNVTLVNGPSNLTATEKYQLSTPNSPAVQYTFGPKVLNKTGDYNFVCSLHSTVMIMNVKVTN